MTRWLSIVGIGEDGLEGLSAAARSLVETAEVLVGGSRHLAFVPDSGADRLLWRRPLESTLPAIAALRGRRVVVLATGDPLWYGIGTLLSRHFSGEELTILPHLSAFSLAAARLGWSLADSAILSLHGRPLDSLRLHFAPNRRALVLSEDGETPRAAARLLTQLGWGESRMTVFEHLGGPREAIAADTAEAWGERRSADLNTIALECRAGPAARPLSRLAGLPDDAFEHDGQLTKREVRAATLAALAPLPGELLWDVGAGCGSIAIEWLRVGEGAGAVAVEADPARAAMIARNAAVLGVPQLRIVAAAAPQALAGLPPPDAVFVGGGLADPGMLDILWRELRPGGRLVANAVTTDSERILLAWRPEDGKTALSRISVSRAEPLGRRRAWRSLMTVTQLVATKPY
ncbi:MAG TPA: precorrin-6y C5,15-methyltransferase (decarboxylating) subunit CbiE [Stellaceae bacterium]|nr:precorrin-6y C5,15-methyltransferase (decarboxylating) subunit CbiE [Stellaceae bacterium]